MDTVSTSGIATLRVEKPNVRCENEKREVAIVEAVLQEARVDQAGFIDHNRVSNVFRRVLGCWHRHMSLPFTRGNETYRTCVDCGARRRFDLEQWRMVGDFYRPDNRSAKY